jgi:outer membrane immunogenic protein
MGCAMYKHNVFALAVIASLCGVGVANAADLRRAPVYKAQPAPVEVFNWTGFYIGANVGYSAGSGRINGFAGSSDLNGIVGGGQIGYNWQAIGSPWVFGVEIDGQGSGQEDSASATIVGVGTATLTESMPWFVTARGRIGYAFAPMFMIYATGGAAWIDHKFQFSVTGLGSLTSEDTRLGWTAGAGIEGALNRNWSWKVEYIHLDTGSYNTNILGVLPATVRVTDEIGRFGINYRF